MRTEDGYIVQKCLDGDSAAFGLLVDRYKKSIYALAYSKVHNFHDAQDITQEAFIKAYRNLRTLRRWDNFIGWLYRITINLSRDWLRSRARRPDAEFTEDQDPETLDYPAMDSYREDMVHETVREALDSLPEMYREVLTLRYFGGMNIREISRFLGTSPSTIDRRLRGARARLKEEMIAMMSATYEQHELPENFTFRIVEIVKRIRIHATPRSTGLPWGLSLAAGIAVVVMTLGSQMAIYQQPTPLAFPGETETLKVREMALGWTSGIRRIPPFRRRLREVAHGHRKPTCQRQDTGRVPLWWTGKSTSLVACQSREGSLRLWRSITQQRIPGRDALTCLLQESG